MWQDPWRRVHGKIPHRVRLWKRAGRLCRGSVSTVGFSWVYVNNLRLQVFVCILSGGVCVKDLSRRNGGAAALLSFMVNEKASVVLKALAL